MKFSALSLLGYSVISPMLTIAQGITIAGHVTDGSTNISYATINVVGRNETATTDDDGIFSMSLVKTEKGDIITLRVIKKGYKPYTKTIPASILPIPIRLSKINSDKPRVTKPVAKPDINKTEKLDVTDIVLKKYNLIIESPVNNFFGLNGKFSGEVSIYKDSILYTIKSGIIEFNKKYSEKRKTVYLHAVIVGIASSNQGKQGTWNILSSSNPMYVDKEIGIDTPLNTFVPYKFKIKLKDKIDLEAAWLCITFSVKNDNGGFGTMYVHSDRIVMY